MFHKKSARFYDAIHTFKDYQLEALKIKQLVNQYKTSEGNTLLDVACGTGMHLSYLQESFEPEGLDVDSELLAVACERLPDIPFHQHDMADFALERQFDIVLCLFSSIGFVKTVPRLRRSIANMAKHLKPGGVLILEPWLLPEFFNPETIYTHFLDEPDYKLARMNRSYAKGDVSILEYHYMVGTPDGVEYFEEVHELGLFTHKQYVEALTDAGLKVSQEFPGLANRGLYIGSW